MEVPLALLGAGGAGAGFLFGAVLPYAAFVLFITGFAYRVIQWSRAPVPFRITATCGQQKTLPWLKSGKLDCPSSTLGVVGRMALEVLFFRSLFRNTRTQIHKGTKVTHGSDKWLWLGALAFHWTLLIILLRHFRFFLEPVPSLVLLAGKVDSFFQITVPALYLTDAVVVAALVFLLLRRVFDARIRHISLLSDYFALFLLLAVVVSGIFMRYLDKTDIVSVKELFAGLVRLQPAVAQGMGIAFYVHLFFVTVLLAFFPFSKLMHMGGIFFSPTRNLANNSRAKRHINPWNHPVNVHTYEQWEEEFSDKLRAAGLPLEREQPCRSN